MGQMILVVGFATWATMFVIEKYEWEKKHIIWLSPIFTLYGWFLYEIIKEVFF